MEHPIAQEVMFRQAQHIMQMVTTVPVYHGTRAELESFIGHMDVIYEIIRTLSMDALTQKSLAYMFVGRISEEVRWEAGISFSVDWQEVKKQLKERYGGTGKPVHKHVLRILSLVRERGESSSGFARRIGAETRQLRTRVSEAGYTPEEAKIRITAYEELIRDVMANQMTEKLQGIAKASEQKTLEEVIAAVWEEDTAETPGRRSDEGGWQTVRPRREWTTAKTRVSLGGGRPGPPREPYRRGTGTYRRNGVQRSQPRPLRCWTCDSVGHFSRECPYLHRRYPDSRREPPVRGRYPEPMETNAQELEERRTGRPRRDDGDTSQDGERGGPREECRGYRRRWEHPAYQTRRPSWEEDDFPPLPPAKQSSRDQGEIQEREEDGSQFRGKCSME